VEAADGLDNVVFAPMQPRERVSEVLATGDLHTVLLKTGLARSSVPSKMYSILAAGRPCLASVDLDTEVDRTLRDANAGRVAAPDDVDAFVATLGEMLDRRDDWAGWGRSGRHWVEEWLSPAAVAESYEQLFEELAGRRSGESSSLR
jgi:colanic acid biosynthesis glycosyl transferase WcaI